MELSTLEEKTKVDALLKLSSGQSLGITGFLFVKSLDIRTGGVFSGRHPSGNFSGLSHSLKLNLDFGLKHFFS
ncbi:MAG: hypothetical protein GY757_47735 [bacterium]|nr:hypothetical protein [bacterium]